MNLTITFRDPVDRKSLQSILDGHDLGEDAIVEVTAPSVQQFLHDAVGDPGVNQLHMSKLDSANVLWSVLNSITDAFPDFVRNVAARV